MTFSQMTREEAIAMQRHMLLQSHMRGQAFHELGEHHRPRNIKGINIAAPAGTTYTITNTLTATLTVKKGVVPMAFVVTDADVTSFVMNSMTVDAFTLVSPSDPPANLASFSANRHRFARVLHAILAQTSDESVITINLTCVVAGPVVFRGINLECIDKNLECTLESTYDPWEAMNAGFYHAGPSLVARTRGLLQLPFKGLQAIKAQLPAGGAPVFP